MISLIIRRVLQGVPVLFIVVTLTFVLVRTAPGNAFSSERRIPPEILAEMEKQYDLHGPIWHQYALYLWKVVHGNLGLSTQYRNWTVNDIIAQSLPVSATLGVLAYCIALFAGISIGAWAAYCHNRTPDRLLMLAALLGISVPSFVTAPLFVLLLAIWLKLLPVSGWGSPDQIILPALCLSIPFTASIARLVRASMLEVLQLDFIRTARAKGLAESTVLFRHALRVAILPVIGFSGPAATAIVTGSIVIEKLFGIPGIGQFFVRSAENRDPFMTSGVVLVFSLILILFNLCTDIVYLAVDRRVKLE